MVSYNEQEAMIIQRIAMPIEIPNTDYKALRNDNYTIVFNHENAIIVTLPADWTLFRIAEWCDAYSIGLKQGRKQGVQEGRIKAGRDIKAALGINTE